MAININQMLTGRTSPLENTGSQKRSESTPAQSSTVSSASSGDSVSLTSEARKLTEMTRQATDAPNTNEAKIARLRAAINDGSYQVDAEKLARNMSSFESQLNDVLDSQ